MEKKDLDFVLVPAGLLLMVGYHLCLLHQVLKRPTRTVIGINAINRRFWVHAMMEDPKNGVLAVQTLRNNIMASTLLASTAIMLSYLIAVLMTNGGGKGSESAAMVVYGNRTQLGYSVKFFSVMVCFTVAFLFNVQSIRYYSDAGILINVPSRKTNNIHLTAEYVGRTMNRGSYFWSLGLRAFYFSFPLFLWIFGPIPMFVSCPALVFLLFFLDFTFDFGWVTGSSSDEEEDQQHKKNQETSTV